MGEYWISGWKFFDMRCIIVVFQLYSDPSTEGKFTTSFTRILFIFDDRFEASILENIVDFHISWIGYTFVFWQYSSFLFCLIWIEIGWINANPSEKKKILSKMYGRIIKPIQWLEFTFLVRNVFFLNWMGLEVLDDWLHAEVDELGPFSNFFCDRIISKYIISKFTWIFFLHVNFCYCFLYGTILFNYNETSLLPRSARFVIKVSW